MARKKLKAPEVMAGNDKKDMEIVQVSLDLLDPHPDNRDVRNPECESLAESIRQRGMLDALMLRPSPISPGRYQIVGGHRRTVAARMAGLEYVPATVRDMGDVEALELVLISNLERKELDPGDVSRGVSALVRAGITVDVLVERINRSREWVQQYLALGELPAPMREAVEQKRVSMATVAEVLRVDAEDRERAVQLVLSPTMQREPLNAEQSRAVLDKELINPRRQREGWEKGMAKRLAGWKKKLAAAAKAAGAPATLVPLDWDGKLPGGHMVYAMEPVREDCLLEGSPEGCVFATLAIRNELPVYVVPCARARWIQPKEDGWGLGDDPESVVLVDANAIEAAEQALRDAESAPMPPWFDQYAGGGDGEDSASDVEMKNEALHLLACELQAMAELVLDHAIDDESMRSLLWHRAYKTALMGDGGFVLVASIMGTDDPEYDEAAQAQFIADIRSVGLERKWPDGWAFLCAGFEDEFRIRGWNLGVRDGKVVIDSTMAVRMQGSLEELPWSGKLLPDVAPTYLELLERSIEHVVVDDEKEDK